MAYEAAERETILQIDDESGDWIVYTRQRKVMTKLFKMDSFVETSRFEEDGKVIELSGTVPYSAMTFRANTKTVRTGNPNIRNIKNND